MINKILFTTFLFLAIKHSYSQQKSFDTTEIEIPVVFHFVTKNEPIIKYTHLQIENILMEATRRMNTVDFENLKTPFDKIARKTYLKLVTRNFDKNCETIEPITYHRTPLNGYTPWVDDAYLRTKGYFKPKEFLNIWVCNLYGKNITGHTPKKEILNGIIIDEFEFNEIIINKNQTWTLVHEIGHWLGLKHIWGSIDTSINIDDCILDDGIDDTPKQKDPHFFNFTFIQDSCNGSGKTNHQNFMDYSYDTGMFTKGQVAVMRNNLKTKRAGLLWKPNCNSNSQSVLSNTKQRTKFGSRMIVNQLYPYGTITDRDMVELFNSIGILPTKENLEKIGLKIVANNKFEDMYTGEFVNQHQIYERLDTNTAKTLYKKGITKASYRNHIGFVNPNPHRRVLILTNQKSKKSYTFRIKKAGINYGDTYTAWTSMPFGVYECQVYGYGQKLIRTFVIDFKKEKQLVKLYKNGLE